MKKIILSVIVLIMLSMMPAEAQSENRQAGMRFGYSYRIVLPGDIAGR